MSQTVSSANFGDFHCQGNCGHKYKLLRESGAVKCRGPCGNYFMCWDDHKINQYEKNKWKLCRDCTKLPTMCKECKTVEVPYGSCKDCWLKTRPPMASGVCLIE